MYYLEIFSAVLFAVLTIVGYRKNSRNIMLAGSLCLLLGIAGPDFVAGFQDGYNASIGA